MESRKCRIARTSRGRADGASRQKRRDLRAAKFGERGEDTMAATFTEPPEDQRSAMYEEEREDKVFLSQVKNTFIHVTDKISLPQRSMSAPPRICHEAVSVVISRVRSASARSSRSTPVPYERAFRRTTRQTFDSNYKTPLSLPDVLRRHFDSGRPSHPSLTRFGPGRLQPTPIGFAGFFQIFFELTEAQNFQKV